MTDSQDELNRIKTGRIERQWSLWKAGLRAGASVASHNAFGWMRSKEESNLRLVKEAEKFADEIGQLKGSVVKIGQMMAMWGEHYLPPEVTQALHRLEDKTSVMSWSVMRKVLDQQPNTPWQKLSINTKAIGAASLGQVHRAREISTGRDIVLKIQYPGVAASIDSDLDTIAMMMKLLRLVPITQEFQEWLNEIRVLLHREVDYVLEAETTIRFATRLKDDRRYRVPEILPEYSSNRVIAMTFEKGERIGSPLVKQLPSSQRNDIARAALDLFWREVFEWGEMQTDPNFGNYLIDLTIPKQPKIILLDYGAVKVFDPTILQLGREVVVASFYKDETRLRKALFNLGFFSDNVPDSVMHQFSELCFLAMEPFSQPSAGAEKNTLWSGKSYRWADSQLAQRCLQLASKAAFSRYFKIPPKEFMFFSRKLLGAFTLMTVLRAEINGYEALKPWVEAYENKKR
ncbi:MAG: AarF/ABC1/UbiB kinase family protein [Pseudomonadota bacterium]